MRFPYRHDPDASVLHVEEYLSTTYFFFFYLIISLGLSLFHHLLISNRNHLYRFHLSTIPQGFSLSLSPYYTFRSLNYSTNYSLKWLLLTGDCSSSAHYKSRLQTTTTGSSSRTRSILSPTPSRFVAVILSIPLLIQRHTRRVLTVAVGELQSTLHPLPAAVRLLIRHLHAGRSTMRLRHVVQWIDRHRHERCWTVEINSERLTLWEMWYSILMTMTAFFKLWNSTGLHGLNISAAQCEIETSH